MPVFAALHPAGTPPGAVHVLAKQLAAFGPVSQRIGKLSGHAQLPQHVSIKLPEHVGVGASKQ
jgi:hypothetical protein